MANPLYLATLKLPLTEKPVTPFSAENQATYMDIFNLQNTFKIVLQNFTEEAPQDGKQYARKDGAWVEVTGGGGGGNPATIKQKKTIIVPSGVGTVTFDAPPTPGNLIVILASRWASSISTNTGWTVISNVTGPTFDIPLILARPVSASDSATYNFSATSTSWCISAFEIENAALSSIVAYSVRADTTGTVISVDPAVPATCLALGIFMAQNRPIPTYSISGAAVLDHVEGARASGGPVSFTSVYNPNAPKGSWTPSCTFSTSGPNVSASVILKGL